MRGGGRGAEPNGVLNPAATTSTVRRRNNVLVDALRANAPSTTLAPHGEGGRPAAVRHLVVEGQLGDGLRDLHDTGDRDGQ